MPLPETLPMTAPMNFFATVPKGMESLLADELHTLGAGEVRETRAGVLFRGTLETAYRACLWSRLANRILLPIHEAQIADEAGLYDAVNALPWERHLTADGTLAVDFTGSGSVISHSHYGALKVKDAIVDRFRYLTGRRPSVALQQPDVRVNVYIYHDTLTVSIDLSGSSLHQRGYRENGAQAPLKENLAAAILIRAGWPEAARQGRPLLDPMCGSGTLPIEAALMAADIAPGLLREYFGFLRWQGHDAPLWQRLLGEAKSRRDSGLSRLPPIEGSDHNKRTVQIARSNVQRAGLEERVRIECRELEDITPGDHATPGLLVANPPYGERLGQRDELPDLYARLGETLKSCFLGWQAAVFTSDSVLGKCIGIRARKRYTLYNGALQCTLLLFDVAPEWFMKRGVEHVEAQPQTLTPGATMFANRLRKNLKHLGRWAKREQITCYRLYDADLPEYAVAVDLYHEATTGHRWAHVQEYEAPRSIDPARARERLQDVMAALPQVLGIPGEQVILKTRQRQKGEAQYEKLADTRQNIEVQEGGCRLLVNLQDYLDTGLFLDHRPTRLLLQQLTRGRRFLNLFAYTGAATVHAARGGARETTTVDMSGTYLEWARHNMALNGFVGEQHHYVQADCLEWLQHAAEDYDVIFLDPPTFSNSKRMQGSFDVQRDHVALIRRTVEFLAPGGVLLFSNNFRRFKMDLAALADLPLEIEEITRATIPQDFSRNPRIHSCWRIAKPAI